MQVGVIPVTAFQQNCSIVHCENTNKAAVVDPGGDLDLLREYIAKEGVEVDKILLTHAHIDHAGATYELMRELGVPVIGPHREDLFLIESLEQQGMMFGLGPARPFVPDRWLEQGDVVAVGDERFEVRHCPGHTPGHVVFYNAARKFVLVGDVLFHGSIGRTDLPRGDHATLLASLRDQILTLPDDVTFLPGHGPTSTIGEQRRANPFLRGL
ncbi:MAG: metallo-beta-lactamase family protein [Myxococcaceae bacterium]|nr:metallo-beta-lactamase family protein [Myxococcaceae bacterium]